jgi:peptidyl-prolyl cis-trans isomerase SurA
LSALVLPAAAQGRPQPAPQLLDRIVAVVGDTILLNSDIEEQLAMLEARGSKCRAPIQPPSVRCVSKSSMDWSKSLVLLHAAKRDTRSSSTTPAWTPRLTSRSSNAKTNWADSPVRGGSEAAADDCSAVQGNSRCDIRKEMLEQIFLQKDESAAPPISEKGLQEEFDKVKSQLQDRPATISFTQVVLPASSDSARKLAHQKADSLLKLIRAGEDFATLAKRFSEDPGSKDQGGDLGWQRASMWVPEFAAALQRLRIGEVSPVIETAYGYHIIRLEKVRGAERQARHPHPPRNFRGRGCPGYGAGRSNREQDQGRGRH